jgi:hypothetical protein
MKWKTGNGKRETGSEDGAFAGFEFPVFRSQFFILPFSQ